MDLSGHRRQCVVSFRFKVFSASALLPAGRLRLALPAIVLGFVLGTLIGLARSSHRSRWLRLPATIYVEFFRGVPLVMVIFWFWFIVPTLLGTSLPEYSVALTAFVVFEAAYLAEIVRAGIQSVAARPGRSGHGDGPGARTD